MRYVQSGYGRKKYQPPKKRWFSGLRKKKSPKKLYRSNEEVAWRSSPIKREKAPLTKLHLALFSFPTLILAWGAVLLYTPFFHITHISYSGLRVTKPNEMQNLVENNFLKGGTLVPKNDYFLVNTGKISDAIREKFPVNSVSVIKHFPNALEIAIDEKISSIIYDNGSKYYLLDQNGMVQRYLKDVDPSENQKSKTPAPVSLAASTISTTSALLAELLGTNSTSSATTTGEPSFIHTPNYASVRREYGGYPLVYDNTMPDITTDKNTILPAKKIGGIIAMYNLIEKGGVARIRYMEVGDAGAGTIVQSNQPWKIYFEPSDDIEAQFANLKAILKSNKPTSYVDVRYGDRVFWK